MKKLLLSFIILILSYYPVYAERLSYEESEEISDDADDLEDKKRKSKIIDAGVKIRNVVEKVEGEMLERLPAVLLSPTNKNESKKLVQGPLHLVGNCTSLAELLIENGADMVKKKS